MRGIETNSSAGLDPDRLRDRDQKLRKTCKDFESMFTYQLLRGMRKTVEKCDLFHGGRGEDIYESLLDQELAKSMAGLGEQSLAAVLYRDLHRRDPLLSAKDSSFSTAQTTGPLSPLQGVVSSGFGWREDPIHGGRRFHEGMDVAAREGAVVRASLDGRVLRSEFSESYGNVIEVDHGNGFTTLYAHNKDNLVRRGDLIRAGDPLATVGSTGRSTAPHLHFEVRRHGRALDPAGFLNLDESPGSAVAEGHSGKTGQEPIDPS